MRALLVWLLLMCVPITVSAVTPEEMSQLKTLAHQDRAKAIALTETYLQQELPLDQLFDVAVLRCNALLDLSQYQQIDELHQWIRPLFNNSAPQAQQILLTGCYAHSLDRQGLNEQAGELIDAAEASFPAEQFPYEISKLLIYKSYQLNSSSNYTESVEALNRATELFKQSNVDDTNQLMELHNAKGNAYNYLNLFDKAIESYQIALHWLRHHGDTLNQSIVLYNLADLEGVRKDAVAMRDYAKQSLELALVSGDDLGVSYADFLIAQSYALQTDYLMALKIAEPLQQRFDEANEIDGSASLRINRAAWLIEIQQYEQAQLLSQQALELYQKAKSLAGELEAVELLAEIYQLTDQPQQAIDALLRLLELTAQIHQRDVDKEIQQLQSELSTSLNEKENQLLRFKDQANQQQLDTLKQHRTELSIAAAALLIFVVLLVAALRRSQNLTKQLKKAADTDPLTGLSNRRYAMNRLDQEHHRLLRHGVPYSVALVDIDRFKSINDSLGHQQGDKVLIAVAQALNEQLRQEDLCCRYGGEEFLLMLPHTEVEQCKQLLERLRQRVEQLAPNFELAELSFSAGIAQSHSEEGIGPLLQRADQALYQAKQQGRNRVLAAR